MEPLKIITNKEEIDLAKNVLAQIKELRVMDGNGNKNLNDQLLGIYKLEDLKRKIDQLVASVEEKYHRENPNPEYVFVESPSNSDSKSNAKKRKIATNKISSLSALSKPSAIAPKTVINSSISPPANIHAKGKPLCAVLVDKEWILGYVISEGKGSKKTCEIADYDNHTQKYIVSINNMIKLTNKEKKWYRWQKVFAWYLTTTTFYRGKVYQDLVKEGVCKINFDETPTTEIYDIDRLFIIEDQN